MFITMDTGTVACSDPAALTPSKISIVRKCEKITAVFEIVPKKKIDKYILYSSLWGNSRYPKADICYV